MGEVRLALIFWQTKRLTFRVFMTCHFQETKKITKYRKHSGLKCKWQSRKGQKYFSLQEFRQIGNVKVLYDHHKDYFCKGT